MVSMDREEQARIAETKRIAPLLEGAIDMHYHGYPEMTLQVKARVEDAEVLEMAREAGMAGIVLKSQMWPTMGRVYQLRQSLRGIECFSSITLNPIAGGLSPWAVDAAARLGAKVVWLPTWGSVHKLGTAGFTRMMKGWFPGMTLGTGLCCTDGSGKVTPDVASIVQLAKDHGLVLCTGHISPLESLAVAREAQRIAYSRLVFTHPLSETVGATLEQTKEMVRRGAYVEFCALNLFHGKDEAIVEFMSELDPSRCIISSDAFREWLPPGPELLRMFIGRLLMIHGMDETSLRMMVRDNPAALLGLVPSDKGSAATPKEAS